MLFEEQAFDINKDVRSYPDKEDSKRLKDWEEDFMIWFPDEDVPQTKKTKQYDDMPF